MLLVAESAAKSRFIAGRAQVAEVVFNPLYCRYTVWVGCVGLGEVEQELHQYLGRFGGRFLLTGGSTPPSQGLTHP